LARTLIPIPLWANSRSKDDQISVFSDTAAFHSDRPSLFARASPRDIGGPEKESKGSSSRALNKARDLHAMRGKSTHNGKRFCGKSFWWILDNYWNKKEGGSGDFLPQRERR
jgi:hypothetical protein